MMVGRPPIWADENDADHDTAIMSTIVHFSSMDGDRFPSDLDASAVDIISKLIVLDPAQRLGSSGGALEVEAHPFFAASGFKWQDAHKLAAPKLAAAPSQGNRAKWTQRSYSMMLSPLPERYTFGSAAFKCTLVVEGEESNATWDAAAAATSAGDGGGGGRRRRIRANKPAMGAIAEAPQ
jgi:hypothetical protein